MAYTEDEKKTGRMVRSIILKVFDTWTLEDFQKFLKSGKAIDPRFLWELIPQVARNSILGHITPENAARFFAGFKFEQVVEQVRQHRPNLLPLLYTPEGKTLIEFYLKGFKQCICPHKGHLLQYDHKIKCTLCEKEF